MFNKDIDRLFQEKFKDFEVNPSPKVWSKIDKKLTPKNKFLNFRIFAIIASVILISSIWYVSDVNSIPLAKKQIVKEVDQLSTKNDEVVLDKKSTQNDASTNDNLKINNSTIINNFSVKNKNNKSNEMVKKSLLVLNNKKTDNFSTKNTTKLINKLSVNHNIVVNSEIKNQIEATNRTITELNKDNYKFELVKLKPVVLIKNEFKLHELQLHKKDIQSEINLAVNETKNNIYKWEIGTVIAPIYYASMTKGSPIDTDISNNKKTSSNSYAYGLNVAYKLNKKWSLRAGVRKTSLSYLTKDVGVVLQVNNENYNLSNGNYRFVTMGEFTNIAADVTFSGDLRQELKYIELPLEVKYALLDKKIGINLNGGISTLFLNNNNVDFEIENGSNINLGEALNVSKTSYSLNLGFDTKLNLSKTWQYSVSPIFKYHLNTFSEKSGGFKPYSIGVNTGLYYSF